MFYKGLTTELEQRTKDRRGLTRARAERIAKRKIKWLDRRLKRAASGGKKRLEIMRTYSPFRYNRDKYYDPNYEAARMAMDIVFEECERRYLAVEILSVGSDCQEEYILIIFW
jgi:predicted helicase